MKNSSDHVRQKVHTALSSLLWVATQISCLGFYQPTPHCIRGHFVHVKHVIMSFIEHINIRSFSGEYGIGVGWYKETVSWSWDSYWCLYDSTRDLWCSRWRHQCLDQYDWWFVTRRNNFIIFCSNWRNSINYCLPIGQHPVCATTLVTLLGPLVLPEMGKPVY